MHLLSGPRRCSATRIAPRIQVRPWRASASPPRQPWAAQSSCGFAGTISLMMELEALPDAELGARAAEWRKRALQGEWEARGVAHQLEAELRRRAGSAFPAYDTLDLRPLEAKQKTGRRWWWPW